MAEQKKPSKADEKAAEDLEAQAREAAKLSPAEKQAALSAAASEAERKRLDEAEHEGGHYIVNGRHVDAHGNDHKHHGRRSAEEQGE